MNTSIKTTLKLLDNKWLRYSLYFLAVAPWFFLRDFTPTNELRYLSIADEALRNGSVFTFHNGGIVYADKPPLYLWIIMLGKTIFGYHCLPFLGIFSFAPALATLHIMDKWTKNSLDSKQRLIAELMLLTAIFFIGPAIMLRMDMLMTMFIILSLNIFFRMYSGESRTYDPILFPIFVFMGIFTKGPMGLIVPLVSTITFLLFKKESRLIAKYWNWKTLGIILALCAIWFTAVYTEGGKDYLNNLLFKQTVNRAVNAFDHKEPFYYYFLTIWYSLAPWSLLAIGTIGVGIKKQLITTDMERFFALSSLSILVVLSLFSSKLEVYLLPVFPFIIYLTALLQKKMNYTRWASILIAIPAGIFSLALPALLIFGLLTDGGKVYLLPAVIIAVLLLSIAGIAAIVSVKNQQPFQAIKRISSAMLIAVFIASLSLPTLNPTIGLKALCTLAQESSKKQGGTTYYYCEMDRAPSMDVYLGQRPIKLKIKDLCNKDTFKKPAILFTQRRTVERIDTMRVFMKGKKTYRTGKYFFIEVFE